MSKDWRAVGPVEVRRAGGGTTVHPTLEAAVRRLGWGNVSGLTDRVAATPFAPDADMRWLTSSFVAEKITLYDEMGLRIPAGLAISLALALGVDVEWGKRRAHWRFGRVRYDFRDGPVPRTGRGRGRHSCSMRYMRTTQERSAADALEHDEDAAEVGLRPRARRNAANLVNAWDDWYRTTQRSWKSNRRTRWKEGG